MIKESASLRIDIGGGVTDIPEIGQEVGTCVTNFALDLFSDDTYSRKRQLELQIKKQVKGGIIFFYNGRQHSLELEGDRDELTLIKATINGFLQRKPLQNSYEISVDDDLPKGTGLGGSAGLSVCLNVGLNKVAAYEKGDEYTPNPNQVLRDAHHFEVEELGIRGGFQDFIGAFFGNVNLINFPSLKSVDLSTHKSLGVKMEERMKDYLNDHMLVFLSTRGNISSSIVVEDEVAQQRKSPQEVNPLLIDIKQYNAEIYNLLTQPGNLEERLEALGDSMNRSWELQKRLSPLVGKAKLTQLEKLVAPYVYGVRGPGSGVNSLFLLMKPDSKRRLLSAISPFSNDIDLLFARVNEKGVQQVRV